MARNKNAHGNRQQNKKRRETLFAYSWSLPSLVLILLIVIFPILYTGYISMTNMNIYHWNNYEFIGLENYKDALLVFDNGFLTALLVTILWTVVNMVLQLVIAFIMATLLNIKGLRLRNVYRTLLIILINSISYALPLMRRSVAKQALNVILRGTRTNAIFGVGTA